MSAVLWLRCVACCWPVGSCIGCQIGRTSRRSCFTFVEWLRSALSEISRDELRPLAAAGGVETRPNHKWRTVAELRDALVKVLAPSREVGCVKNGF